MKTKDFNVGKELEKIAKKLGENETLFAIYLNEDEKDVCVLTTGDDDTNIICTFAAMLELSLKGKGDEGMDRATNIILEALKMVQASHSIAGLKLATELLKGVLEKDGLLKDNDDDDEDDEIVEDCENCEFIRECNNDSAIKYRKEHGIPRPKRNKKGGRKVDVN
jgi:Trk K+ transport system NAD-binding subunit